MGALYQKGLKHWAKGEIAWKASGGSTIRATLVKSAYTPDTTSSGHEFFSDLGANALGNSGGATYADGVGLTLVDAEVNGVCDASDATVTSVTTGQTVNYIVIYKDGGSAGASPLLVVLDNNGSPFNFPTDGGNVNINFDNGANKIIKI